MRWSCCFNLAKAYGRAQLCRRCLAKLDRTDQALVPDFNSVSYLPYLLFVHVFAHARFSPEIVELREFNLANNVTTEPEFNNPGYQALVEENIKESVSNIANDPAMQAVCLSFISLYSAAGTNLVLPALGCLQPGTAGRQQPCRS